MEKELERFSKKVLDELKKLENIETALWRVTENNTWKAVPVLLRELYSNAKNLFELTKQTNYKSLLLTITPSPLVTEINKDMESLGGLFLTQEREINNMLERIDCSKESIEKILKHEGEELSASATIIKKLIQKLEVEIPKE